jgi:hypothetical protein
MRSYARFTKDVYGCQRSDTSAIHTNENHIKATQHRQTDGQRHAHAHAHARTHTHTHTHTWMAGVQHIGHILVVSIILEAQSLHTHKCAQGKNKCGCMLSSPLV